jgi:acyl carrier protein
MDDDVRAVVARHLELALGAPVPLDGVPDDASLESLGLDSLAVVSALVGLSEECGADLVAYMDRLVAPRVLGDLLGTTAEWLADREGAQPSPA